MSSGYDVVIVGAGSAGCVYGVEGLSVADASILPEIPSANTNIPVIMVAEHVAAHRTPQRASRHALAGTP
jgi:choline dehydrogenase-like flavoprotein